MSIPLSRLARCFQIFFQNTRMVFRKKTVADHVVLTLRFSYCRLNNKKFEPQPRRRRHFKHNKKQNTRKPFRIPGSACGPYRVLLTSSQAEHLGFSVSAWCRPQYSWLSLQKYMRSTSISLQTRHAKHAGCHAVLDPTRLAVTAMSPGCMIS